MARFMFKGYDHRIWVLFFSILIDGTGYSIISPFLAIYMHDNLGMSMAAVGVVFLVGGIASAVGNLVGGIASDKLGRKGVMTYSMLARTLSFLGLAVLIAVQPDMLLITIVLCGTFFFGGVFSPANNAMVADVVEPARRLEAYGLLRVAWNLGFAIGPAIGGVMLLYSFFLTFLTSALISLVAALMVGLMLTESWTPKPQEKRTSLFREIKNVKLVFLLFCLACIPMFIMSGQFATTYSVYANERVGIDTFTIGLVFGLNGLMVVLMQMPLARWLEPWNKYLAMALGTAIYTIGYFMVGLVFDGLTLGLSMFVITIGEMVVVPVSTDLSVSMATEDEKGKYLGVFGLITSVGWFGSTLIGGVLYDVISVGWLLWSAISLLGVVTLLALLPLWLRNRSPTDI
ncbi:MAG: multidrug resistance protein MdtH [Methanomassiliicoccales archaeon PtaU1.Bin124]|nr:MAG: multidrug resistance protein MdtH [Methanomassiliicoccales archaeon PtaU1.Bin124]